MGINTQNMRPIPKFVFFYTGVPRYRRIAIETPFKFFYSTPRGRCMKMLYPYQLSSKSDHKRRFSDFKERDREVGGGFARNSNFTVVLQ